MADPVHRQAVLADFVIPEVRALPGFEQAVWLNDSQGIGTCLVRFATEAEARDAVPVLTREGGPEVLACSVSQVEADA
jgi:hypothetical protein